MIGAIWLQTVEEVRYDTRSESRMNSRQQQSVINRIFKLVKDFVQ